MSIVKKMDLFHLSSIVSLFVLLGMWSLDSLGVVALTIAGLFLGIAIMSSIHHAEAIAHKIGASIGALVLAVAVTVIEVGLIISMMSSAKGDSLFIARDTVFSAVIIVVNGIVGICFLLGGWRFKEPEFRPEGASALLAVLATLVGITLILPNFTTTTHGPTYSNSQLIFVSLASLILYVALIIAQTMTHKDYFSNTEKQVVEENHNSQGAWLSGLFLVLSLCAVIGLAKALSPFIKSGLASLGAPSAAAGIVIALLVLLPEVGAAMKAARANHLQTSLNLSLGSGVASVALTIPAISIYSIMTGEKIGLGLDPKEMAFTILTFLVCSLTMGTGKATSLKGVVHLMILLTYITLTFIP